MGKFIIELKEVGKNKMYMHQPGFTLSENGEEKLSFCTIVPGGAPYVFVKSGIHKGKRFIVDLKELQTVCEQILYDKI